MAHSRFEMYCRDLLGPGAGGRECRSGDTRRFERRSGGRCFRKRCRRCHSGVHAGISISGHLSTEDGASISSLPDYRRMRVSMTPMTSRGPLIPNLAAQISADGSFHIEDLQPDDYKVSVSPAPSGVYLKEVRLGQFDIMNGVSINGPVSGSLEVLLSPKAGQIQELS